VSPFTYERKREEGAKNKQRKTKTKKNKEACRDKVGRLKQSRG